MCSRCVVQFFARAESSCRNFGPLAKYWKRYEDADESQWLRSWHPFEDRLAHRGHEVYFDIARKLYLQGDDLDRGRLADLARLRGQSCKSRTAGQATAAIRGH